MEKPVGLHGLLTPACLAAAGASPRCRSGLLFLVMANGCDFWGCSYFASRWKPCAGPAEAHQRRLCKNKNSGVCKFVYLQIFRENLSSVISSALCLESILHLAPSGGILVEQIYLVRPRQINFPYFNDLKCYYLRIAVQLHLPEMGWERSRPCWE